MNSSDALAKLYQLFSKLEGPKQAREVVRTTINLALYDIYEEGQEFTAELYDQKIISQVSDYLEAAEAQKIA